MVVDPDLEPTGEGLSIGEGPVVADAEFLQLLSELGGEHVVGRRDAVGEVGGPPIGQGLLAEERQRPGALGDVGHLVVVVEMRGQRRTDLVDVGIECLSRIAAALVAHLLGHAVTGERSHVGEGGETGVADMDQTDLVVDPTHLAGEGAGRIEIGAAAGVDLIAVRGMAGVPVHQVGRMRSSTCRSSPGGA
jgi:hypothetical protein